MDTFGALKNSEVCALIDEHVRGQHGERNRRILKRRLLDGIGYEKLSEEFEMSPSQIVRIVHKCLKMIQK